MCLTLMYTSSRPLLRVQWISYIVRVEMGKDDSQVCRLLKSGGVNSECMCVHAAGRRPGERRLKLIVQSDAAGRRRGNPV